MANEILSEKLAVKTGYGFVIECDAAATQRRIMVPFVTGEPLFVTMLRGYVMARAVKADESKVSRALAKRLLALKEDLAECDKMFGEAEVPTLPWQNLVKILETLERGGDNPMGAMQTTAQSEAEFQQKMQERMRAAMGDLMPDAVLADIVAKGIQKAFFESKVVERRESWHGGDVLGAPWVVTFLKDACEKQVAAAVNAWLAANPTKIEEALRDSLAGGLVSSFVKAFDRVTRGDYDRLEDGLRGVLMRVDKMTSN